MIICSVSDRLEIEGWKRGVFDFKIVPTLPRDAEPSTPNWSERILEWSLLRNPTIVPTLLGIPSNAPLIALKQVARIDLYFRTAQALHLVEVKKPTQFKQRHWRAAVSEVVNQWVESEVWLRQGASETYLWVLCPVEWKARKAQLPRGWRSEITDVSKSKLEGRNEAELGVLFYSVFQRNEGHAGKCFLALWRGDEGPPSLPT